MNMDVPWVHICFELTFGLHGEGEGERQGDVSLAAEIGNDCILSKYRTQRNDGVWSLVVVLV